MRTGKGSGRVAGRKEPNRRGACRYEKKLKQRIQARQRDVGRGQTVGKGENTTGERALRVDSGAKLVGNVTLRVSKGDRRNGEMECWSGGMLGLKGAQKRLIPAGNSLIVGAFGPNATAKLWFQIVQHSNNSSAPPLHSFIWHSSCEHWRN